MKNSSMPFVFAVIKLVKHCVINICGEMLPWKLRK